MLLFRGMQQVSSSDHLCLPRLCAVFQTTRLKPGANLINLATMGMILKNSTKRKVLDCFGQALGMNLAIYY
jgi:hypothetical protein